MEIIITFEIYNHDNYAKLFQEWKNTGISS